MNDKGMEVEAREGSVWNIFFMHLVGTNNTFYVHPGDGGWTFREVHEYVLRRLHRGDIAYKDETKREMALLEWAMAEPAGYAFTAFNDARLSTVSAFGIYEYPEGGDRIHAAMDVAERVCTMLVEANDWKQRPSVHRPDHDDFVTVSQGVLDMRLDLLAASTGVPRTALPLGTTQGLLDWDDAVTETFEYLLHLQKMPGISEADYRETSHLLHRVSLNRWSLMDRIKREGIHVESNPDLDAG
ncbi:hypothetical protein ACFW2V_12825 [Streptomyces sp. NPDC058947]|uniref:hypothetical protein n=1 Tax=Streptomyces sp. NPDC058947 TaxID=3346675 RepID=UPI00367CD619